MGKDSKAMQQPGFQCLIGKIAGEKYGKTFVINSSKPLSLPPENSGPENDTQWLEWYHLKESVDLPTAIGMVKCRKFEIKLDR